MPPASSRLQMSRGEREIMTATPRPETIQACVFDAYGTLFDVHSAVGQHRARLGAVAEQVSVLWRTKQLEYTWLRSLMQRHVDFWQITQEALAYALDAYQVHDVALQADLVAAYLQLACYPEIPTTLRTLKRHGYRTAILSNGAPMMLQAAVRNSGLDDLLDQTLSVEAVGVYKPDPRVYQLAVDALGVPAPGILFHSSNAWDAAGAATFGMRVAWINRFGQRRERLPDGPEVELASLADIPVWLGLQTAG